MAHNIITGKEVPGDWSCGIEPVAAPTKEPRSLMKVGALTALGVGAVVGAAWTLLRGRGSSGAPPTMILSRASRGSYRVNPQAARYFGGRK